MHLNEINFVENRIIYTSYEFYCDFKCQSVQLLNHLIPDGSDQLHAMRWPCCAWIYSSK